LLVNRARYRHDFVRQSLSFEPLSNFARHLLSDRKFEDLVLRKLPEQAVIYEFHRFSLVDVRRLEQAWTNAEP
jgi:hypothetical protein